MLDLKDRSYVPPGGYRYRQPESGLLIHSTSFLNLIEAVRLHRVANHYPIPHTFESDVANGVCLEVSEACQEVSPSGAAKPMGLADVLRLTGLVGESLLRGQPVVDDALAEHRAATCAGCRDNVDPSGGCSACQSEAAAKLMASLVGSRATRRDADLKTCRHCGCFNKVQLWIPGDILRRHSEKATLDLLPRHCWKREENDIHSTPQQ